VKDSSDNFLTFLYFYPYVLIINYVIANIFLGVCYDAFTEVKSKMTQSQNDTGEGITLKEFLRLTYLMVKPGAKFKQNMQKVEINEQMLESFDPRKVFEEFRETMNQHGNFKDMKLWVAMCTKNIMLEYETRRSIKKMCKEVALVYMNDANNDGGKVKEVDYQRKLKEYCLREKYWNYYRIGSYQLLKFMTTFSNKIAELEELIDHPTALENRQKEREKIKLYILELEKEIENNLTELNKMRLVLNEYEKNKKTAVVTERKSAVSRNSKKSP